MLSLALSFLYLSYFKFLYKGDKGKVEKEVLTLKKLSKQFIISSIICLPVFLILSRPIPLTKIFDIDNFNDVTNFSLLYFEETELYITDHPEESKLELLNLLSTFKVKRSLNSDNSRNDYFIKFYQDKYKSDDKSKLASLSEAGYIKISTNQYKVISHEDLLSKIYDFIKNN